MARYRVESVLGSGGMGVVSSAFDTVRGHDVALKRLAIERFASARDAQQATALFEREYYTLSQLAHPHIIAVYDYGLDDGGPYYTMERLEGRSLRESAPLGVTEACSLARDIASALAVVHSRRLVHRDVTSLNVIRLPDGRAKLIDFGAMMPVGAPKNVVGTAPFIAPECLALSPLDERVDLYSLGACLYFALAGRHAYGVGGLRELPSAWRRAPAPPSTFAPDVPATLDQLVMALLSLKPAGRPAAAAEVFERLTVVAGLPRGEAPDVARAYLTTPALVGRDAALASLRRRALKASRRNGGSVIIEGPSGVGRSRLLDAGVLVAKLSGLRVARVDASDGLAPFGAVRRLLQGFGEGSSGFERRADEAGLSGFLRGEEGGPREELLRAATALVLSECDARSSVLVVDDVHRIDEPSLAFVAGLSTLAPEHGLLLLSTADSDGFGGTPAAALLMESSSRLSVAPLDEASSRSLLSSLFGDAPGLDTLAAVTYRRYRGNPRDLMDAAEHLTDRGLIRYEGGGWLIAGDPAALDAALPGDDTAKDLLARLSPDAVELASALALDRDVITCLADYPSLTAHGDMVRVNRALDELIRARLVTPAADRHPFRRESHRRGIVSGLSDPYRRELHRRLAERVSTLALPRVYEAFHFLKAGLWQRAVEPIERYRDHVESEPQAAIIRSPITLEMLGEILSLPEQPDTRALRAEHGAGLVMNAIYQGSPERAVPHVRGVLESLSWFTGLTDYHARPDLEPGARLGYAMQLAGERCAAGGLPSFHPVAAVRRLSQASVATAVCAHFMADPELLALIPDLTPFEPLSPAIGVLSRLLGAVTALVHGRDWEAWDAMNGVREELKGPLADTLDPLTRMGLERVTLGYLCALEAERAHAAATGHIDEYSPFMPNLAESHRARHCLSLGDVSGAAVARRRSEVLSVSAGSLADARILELPGYATLYALSDDLLGLGRTLDAIQGVVRTRPRWRPRLDVVLGHVHRCRGELSAALASIERSLADPEDRDAELVARAALHVDLLRQVGRLEDARRAGLDSIARAHARRLPTPLLELCLASVHAELGESAEAERLFESARAALEARGIGGMHLGHCYDIGARIALFRGDRDAFEARARMCAERYTAGNAPSLVAKYDALTAWAKTRDPSLVGVARGGSEDADLDVPTALERPGSAREASTALESAGPHHEILSMLVERVGAKGGFLYTVGGDGLERTGRTPGFDPPDDLDDVVALFYAEHVEQDAAERSATAIDAERLGLVDDPGLVLETPSGHRLTPWLLECRRDGARQVRGVVVLALEDARASVFPDAIAAAAAALASRALAPSEQRPGRA